MIERDASQNPPQTDAQRFSGRWCVAAFCEIVDVTQPDDKTRSFVVSNRASGRHFMANSETVQLLDGVRVRGSLAGAVEQAGLTPQTAGPTIERLIQYGLIVQPGSTHAQAPATKTPWDARLLMTRWDLLDISGIVARLRWVGRFAYGPLGYALWLVAMGAMIFALLDNPEKLRLSLLNFWQADALHWITFAGLYVALKAVHELGHAFAYKEMLRQEGFDPGPIRAGISLFALTPFPFTDVSAAWQLRARWRKMMIGAGGIYLETWAMAAITLIWANTQSGLLQTAALQVAVVSGVLALAFNLNPAVKLDGYFILTDYLGRYNLMQRASNAARTWVANRLGAALPRVDTIDLSYWVVSYAYRWTIFAGIFWVAYQVDTRLAPVVLTLILLALVLRPAWATVRSLRGQGIRSRRVVLFGTVTLALVAAVYVPFEDRLLMHGHLERFETRFVTVSEPAKVSVSSAGIMLHSPELDTRLADLSLQIIMLENLERAQFLRAAEQARLRADRYAQIEALAKLEARKARLDYAEAGGIWTDFGAENRAGVWVAQSTGRIGAVSSPAPVSVRLRLNQNGVARSDDLAPGALITLRSVADPICVGDAYLSPDTAQFVAEASQISLKAHLIEPTPKCIGDLPHGAALRARLPVPPSSLARRAGLLVSRLLQDRLDFNPSQ